MRLTALALVLILALASAADAQTFVKITDVTNPIVADLGPSQGYPGASWIDYDGDGLPDLWSGQMGLYHNLGNGQFEKIAGVQAPVATGVLGNSWADYDNDGDPDLFTAGSGTPPGMGSFLWRNDSAPGTASGPFTKVLVGAMGDSAGNGGWAAAWGDYDNDGRADLVVAGLTGLATIPSNHLLHNLGGDLFERDTTTQVDNFIAPYTVPSWSDFDQDGDVDLFIGSGPANGLRGPDYCFRNGTTGAPGATRLDRIGGSPYVDNRDGQIWNWIDYDNDGDLDVYVTNYGGGFPGLENDLYRNNAGALVKQVSATVGTIVSDRGLSLASVWGDFDDDGDLDCVVTNDGSGRNKYYRNDVDSTGKFIAVTVGTPTGGLTGEAGAHRGACAGDYDLDGRLDLFIAPPLKSLFHNETVNGWHWAEFRLVGTNSNRSALGARIRVLATIKGQPRWQLREISAQNSFNGQNDLVVHFGLREAALIESVRVEWPSGLVEEAAGGPADRMYTIVEGQLGPTPTRIAFAAAQVTNAGAMRLTWSGALDPGTSAIVERSEDETLWQPLGALAGSTGGLWIFEDGSVEAGKRYAYRLALSGPKGEQSTTAATWVEVPGTLEFGFGSVPANPCRIGEGAAFVLGLGRTRRGRLELLAASGRVVWKEELTAPAGAVRASVPTAGLRPGVYWARVSAGAESAIRKFVLVR